MLIEKIIEFTGNYRFLSNFYRTPVCYNEIVYSTSEHAFQAAKCHIDSERKTIELAITPGAAKRLGQKVVLIPNWQNFRIGIMYRILHSKFSLNNNMRDRLLATGDAELFEGNIWGDVFWGCTADTLEGENNLGKLLMKVRTEIRMDILGLKN